MTMNKIFELAIKEHIKERDDLFLDEFKGLKVLSSKYTETITCFDGITLNKYRVSCSIKAKKYENNRVFFQINLYDDPNGNNANTIGVYYDGSSYEA